MTGILPRVSAGKAKGDSIVNVLRLFKSPAFNDGGSEQRLVHAAQRGDRHAFDALTRAHVPLLRGYLRRRVGPDAVEDVLQETLIAGWTSLSRYSRRARFKVWLFSIAAHKCADHYRLCGRGVTEIPLREAESMVGHRDVYEALDWKQAIQNALAQLPDEQRAVLELYYYAELTLAEVATVLGRNLNTVKYQFYRAHAQVEQELAEADRVTGENGSRKVPSSR